MFILTSLLTLSMKTSLGALISFIFSQACNWNAYNSSRQRIGAPMASQRDNKRHIVEKDFSPPDKVLVWRP